MRIGSREFTPPLWAIALYVVILLLMLKLGFWQIGRAALKVTLQESAAAAEVSEAKPLASISDLEAAAVNYQRTVFSGRYDTSRQFLWDNRTSNGVAGFEVIAVMRLLTGELALVNRGWTPPGPDRQTLPDVSLPAAAAQSPISVEGYLSRPSKGFASGDAVSAESAWPKILQYLDYEAIGEALGEPILPVLVQPQALGVDAISTTVLTSRPEWLTANWQPAASGPAKHYSYAFQWFAMALALTGIFFIVNTRKLRQ